MSHTTSAAFASSAPALVNRPRLRARPASLRHVDLARVRHCAETLARITNVLMSVPELAAVASGAATLHERSHDLLRVASALEAKSADRSARSAIALVLDAAHPVHAQLEQHAALDWRAMIAGRDVQDGARALAALLQRGTTLRAV